jgi:hypothetical protein
MPQRIVAEFPMRLSSRVNPGCIRLPRLARCNSRQAFLQVSFLITISTCINRLIKSGLARLWPTIRCLAKAMGVRLLRIRTNHLESPPMTVTVFPATMPVTGFLSNQQCQYVICPMMMALFQRVVFWEDRRWLLHQCPTRTHVFLCPLPEGKRGLLQTFEVLHIDAPEEMSPVT